MFHFEDVQQIIGGQEEGPPQPQGRVSTLKMEEPQPPYIKEELEEVWITREEMNLPGPDEADPTKFPLTGVPVKTEELGEKPPESSQLLHTPNEENRGAEPSRCRGYAHVRPLVDCRARISIFKQEDPHPPFIKEEEEDEEEVWITQDGGYLLWGLEADFTNLPLTGVSVKTEDDEKKPPGSSQLHHSPSEANRGAEPTSCSSIRHMAAEAEGDHYGGSQADALLAPLSDSEAEDGNDTQEPLSSGTDKMRTHTYNNHSDCSKKKTGKKCLICSFCDKSFAYQRDFARHMTIHTGEKPFSCLDCGQKFSQKSNMVTHRITHTGEKAFSCLMCDKKFFKRANMTVHMRTHTGEKPFRCSVCGQRFTHKVRMASHMTSHTGEKPFSCSDCGKKFSERSNVAKHMKTHTGEKPLSCSVCCKRFSEKSHMASHMRTHTGEKPLSCPDCGKRFAQTSTLGRHVRTHTGEKPFSCVVCGQRFTQKSHMVSHARTHTGEKPFSCSVCQQRFTQKSNMLSHVRTHNGGETKVKYVTCSIVKS
ncbi:gastrula zinc finger protein XlCGF57.1-like isoform X2 [Nerophis ophidion]|uniref:gastrula zinc finger protein XlCGF57.1-like isoform X2 n=1 Tax=Nerophis ophidion TaxID=159077 RepID=UPI002ADFA7F5|nr:gastrula zinc finger protein XlCGF57.1-like isoform X2 [Nerophis ophidion]